MSTPVEPDLIGLTFLHADYEELVDARPDYDRAELFYNGMIEEKYASPKVAQLLNRFGLNDFPSFNLAHIAVDALTDYLHLNSVTVENNALDNVLDDLRDANDLDEEIPELLKNASKLGDAYLFVWPDTDTDGNTIGVRMEQQDPRVARVFYSPENPTVMDRALQSWETGHKETLRIRANIYYADHIERWSHKGKVPKDPKRAKWEPFSEDGAPAYIPNPFGQVPYFHYRTARPYGIPLHINAYGPQLAINKLVTSHLATVDYQSFPQRYALVNPGADLSGPQAGDFTPEHPLDGMSPEAPMPSQLDSSPAALWNLEGYSQVGQFEAADPDAFLKPFDRYIKAMAQATQIPFQAFDSTGDAISGESRRVANEPLYNRVEALQRSFGSALRRAFGFALSVLDEPEADITINWKPARNINDLQGWQTLILKRQMGVPDDVLLAEAGYNSADIDQWLAAQPEPIPTVPDVQNQVSQVGDALEGVATNDDSA
ncbi:phage portal protein [Streptomyces sp. NBC_01239]|uniref:phage portal protein n=1 Tax=Streptomyces sp. NBC_01239 TaxID=2903792 RepID=UPI002256BFDE|nr:phage portal protein [Streptomyces sp. NBC_01239]MCX4813684.1 phage portal protein [Streptomyces sp. NBC_01239]